MQYLTFSDLDAHLLEQYRNAINFAFPEVILNSQTTKKYWSRLEEYFPNTQLFMIREDNKLIGFMNIVPIFWDQPFTELPEEGWDWLVKKGISDFESGIQPNSLGGLQIVVTQEFQGQGFSKLLIARAKKVKEDLGHKNFIIPIRPILKYKFPEMKMKNYMSLQENGKIMDPWIRTHLESGAKIIKVCEKSMNVIGDIHFWENLLDIKIIKSGTYMVDGALNLIKIDVKNNFGEYKEENIWIYYA
ncbi:GNAT family N-acetyltransferase [uncultured Aquimarina sp.]|uniref:GNAT family N-acetyltransferase n=1 Tax=uncultured Aquimarina sp. TaxID=575652 RepID=UPI002616A5F7|nr:GNAT family N-acetyltransferase [uncultured Aquimarina sp.]